MAVPSSPPFMPNMGLHPRSSTPQLTADSVPQAPGWGRRHSELPPFHTDLLGVEDQVQQTFSSNVLDINPMSNVATSPSIQLKNWTSSTNNTSIHPSHPIYNRAASFDSDGQWVFPALQSGQSSQIDDFLLSAPPKSSQLPSTLGNMARPMTSCSPGNAGPSVGRPPTEAVLFWTQQRADPDELMIPQVISCEQHAISWLGACIHANNRLVPRAGYKELTEAKFNIRGLFSPLQQKFGEQECMIAQFKVLLRQVRTNPMHQLRLYHPNECEGSATGNTPRNAMYLVRQISSREEHPRASLHASCLMQTQLAWATVERKQEIIQAVRAHTVPLSKHQHGNWLVQKAIKADPTLVASLLGYCLSLALSEYGYHVLVYVIKSTCESYARFVVDELLSQDVFETVRTKTSIHVWQQALEVHWVEEPSYRERMIGQLKNALRGRWAEVARSEWGSILLQSWFESAGSEEKQEAINELLAASPALLVHPRAVWVMEHILKFGDAQDKHKVLHCIARHATLVTLSPYGQKMITEALHQGDTVFISRYAGSICMPSSSASPSSVLPYSLGSMSSGTLSPAAQMELNLAVGGAASRRPALIDLALRDHGDSMVLTLLSKCNPATRELVLRTVARNAVLLKGDPHGSKVEKMCQRARVHKQHLDNALSSAL